MKKMSVLFISLALFLVACGNKDIETNMSETVADFNFTTQDNESLSLADLEGKWWVADFIFTNCTTVCLPMTNNMKKLQDKMAEEGLENVQLVSFSVDPDNDSPEVLKKYAEEYGADLNNWSFLTGYDFETIREFSVKSFRSLVQEPQPGDDQVAHGTRFFLVDPEGKIVKNYSGTESAELDDIIDDLKVVAKE